MKTYTVMYVDRGEADRVFVTTVPSAELADRIAQALMNEGFTHTAWIEEE